MSKNILIVEDEEILADVLKKKLEKDGFSVRTAKDGVEGLKAIEAQEPDVVLLDIVMPKKNGYEVLEALGKRGRVPAIIIISNSGQPVEIDRALSLGAKDYIIKAQFTPEEVSAKVQRLLKESGTTIAAPVGAAPRPTTSVIKQRGSTGLKVLIVEDDQFLRDLCVQKLQREGFRVLEAIDGSEGLKLVESERPDAVLLDIILPGIDGFDVLRKIREHKEQAVAKTPVILLSNLGQESDVKKGMKLGANDYLIKANFTIDEIIEKVKATVKK